MSFGRRLQSPFQALGKETLIKTGTSLIERAQNRVVLVARTPMPLVGTRPYDNPRLAIPFEKEHFDAFERLIDEAVSGGRRTFRCVASLAAMSEELKVGPSEFRSRVRERIEKLDQKCRATSPFELRWIPKSNPRPMTYLVADDKFLIWLKDKTNEDVCITAANDRIAGALDSLSSNPSVCVTLTGSQVIAELGLDGVAC